MFGSSTPEMPYNTFVENIGAYGVNSLGEWCNKCETTDARGCDVINALNDTLNDFVSPARTTGRHRVSPLVAGVIGALVGIVAALVVMFLGGAALKKTYRRKVVDASSRRRSEEAESVSPCAKVFGEFADLSSRLMRWRARIERRNMRRSESWDKGDGDHRAIS